MWIADTVFFPIEEGRGKGLGVPAARKSDRCHVLALTGFAVEKRVATEQVFLLYVAMTPPQRSLLPERVGYQRSPRKARFALSCL